MIDQVGNRRWRRQSADNGFERIVGNIIIRQNHPKGKDRRDDEVAPPLPLAERDAAGSDSASAAKACDSYDQINDVIQT